MIQTVSVSVSGQGLHDISPQITRALAGAALQEGLCTLYIRHSSASLLIQEDCDPSARVDLENRLNRLAPENDPLYTYSLVGR